MPMRLLFILFTLAYLVLPVLAGSAMAAETSTVFVEVKDKLDESTGIIQAQLSLSGQVSGKKTLWIKQRNFVFFYQTLYSGPFHLRHISPFFPDEKMSVVLKNEIGETQSIDIYPIPSQQKTLALNDAGALKIETVVARNQTQDSVTPAQVPTVNAEYAVAATSIAAEEQEFDLSFINRGRGGNINQNIIKNLNQIIPGRYAVDLVLNETFIAKIDVNFTRRGPDSDANACLTAQHIFQLGIKPEKLRPQALEIFKSADLTADDKDGKKPCLYINEWVENSSEKYNKGELVLAVSVPQAFIKKNKQQSLPTNMLSFGETAGFTNYNFNTFQSSYQGIKNSGQFLSLDSGLNMLGWQLRQSSYASANSNSPAIYKTGDLSANRTLIDWKSRLSLGAISSQSPVIGSVPVKGIRIASEEGLLPDEERSFKPVVKGFARTNARIKIKQNTVVFFEQNIPPGPFEFTELNPVSNIGEPLTDSISIPTPIVSVMVEVNVTVASADCA
jgi:outer membrane usher protein FimD/PapC